MKVQEVFKGALYPKLDNSQGVEKTTGWAPTIRDERSDMVQMYWEKTKESKNNLWNFNDNLGSKVHDRLTTNYRYKTK